MPARTFHERQGPQCQPQILLTLEPIDGEKGVTAQQNQVATTQSPETYRTTIPMK